MKIGQSITGSRLLSQKVPGPSLVNGIEQCETLHFQIASQILPQANGSSGVEAFPIAPAFREIDSNIEGSCTRNDGGKGGG